MMSLSTVSAGDGYTSPSTALAIVNSSSPSLGTHAGPKPTVIGLYGISGSGKSFLLSRLQQELG